MIAKYDQIEVRIGGQPVPASELTFRRSEPRIAPSKGPFAPVTATATLSLGRFEERSTVWRGRLAGRRASIVGVLRGRAAWGAFRRAVLRGAR